MQDNGQNIIQSQNQAFMDKVNAVSFIMKKTEKIVTAIYMVTDFMSDTEPLKGQIRGVSLKVLSKAHILTTCFTEPRLKVHEEILISFDEIGHYLRLAETLGIISLMNTTILQNETKKVCDLIEKEYGQVMTKSVSSLRYQGVVLTDNMFALKDTVKESIEDVLYKGQVDNKGQQVQKNVLLNENKPAIASTVSIKKNTNLGIKIARRNDVLNVIKSKGQASIKDIKFILKDLNEKTIQRELLALVKEGVLIKKGEKRWSVYLLA